MAAAPELVQAPDQAIRTRLNANGFEMLVACCRQGAGLESWFSAGTLNWEKFIALAENHRVIPQVYRALEPYSAEIPAPMFSRFQRKYKQSACNALWFTQELTRIVNFFEAFGIRAVPYKGPVLAQKLYGEVTARQYHDLDVLVLPEDVQRAKAALRELGYVCSLNLCKEFERAYESSGYEYSFDGASRPYAVELQWRILPRFYSVDFDLEACFGRAEKVRVGDCPCLSLCSDDLLLVLCAHAAKHLWAQISWILDISKLVDGGSIDSDRVWEQAKELGIRRIVALNLQLARELFGSSVPCRIQEWFDADDDSLALKHRIVQRIKAGQESETQSIAYFRLMSRIRERQIDKARMWWRLLWTPSLSEWNEIRLPQPLFRFYSLIRLLRLAKRFAVPA